MSAVARPRLIPVVIGATAGLLALKVIGLATQGGYLIPPDRQGFGRALTDLRKTPAWANGDITGATPAKKAPVDAASPKPAEPGAQPLPAPPPTAAEREVLESLAERRRQLEEKARELDLREQLLKSAEKLAQERMEEIRKSEARIEAEAVRVAPELKALAGMYEVMKPRDAARVFEKMDAQRLLPLARQINPKKLAEVMAAMSPEAAEKLTGLMLPRAAPPSARPPAAPQIDELPRLPPEYPKS